MICEKLIEAKKKRGLTNQQIADGSGVPIGTVNRIFSGGAVDLKFQTLQQLAPVLNISLDTLEVKAPAVISQPHEEHEHHPQKHSPHHYNYSDCPNYDQINVMIGKMDENIIDLRKVRRTLFTALMIMVAVVVFLFAADILIPNAGWIQY